MKNDKITLNIENIYKQYDTIIASNNISFSTKMGEIIAILGPNGAGKSTLINMISGYLAPTSGEIFVLGKNIKDNAIFAKENIGFLPEGSPLYPDLTVRMFLKYMAELRNVKKDRFDEVVEIANIQNVLNQKIETLSKGYQRRVGFAQSILSNPPILLLDEPTDGLDPNQKEHMRNLIKSMAKDKTILISTHLLDEAETICNRIIIMAKGKIKIDGNLKEILKKAKAQNLATAFKNLTIEEN